MVFCWGHTYSRPGVTLSSTGTRRRPNAFNLYFQLKTMQRLTGKDEDLEVTDGFTVQSLLLL